MTFETTVSSATSNPEDKVVAKVRQDVSAGGRVVLPAGSELRGHAISARRSGKVKGRASLSLRFSEVVVGGKTDIVSTQRIALVSPAARRVPGPGRSSSPRRATGDRIDNRGRTLYKHAAGRQT